METGDTKGVKALTERYCPILRKNVAMEVLRCGHRESNAVCLYKGNCEKEIGGCKNAFMPKGGHENMV